jgi:hypothetical protein
MVIRGRIENGVVVFPNGVSLPEGVEVTVFAPNLFSPGADDMSADERRRYLDALACIDAVSNEKAGDDFSGADHDRAIYGRP